MSKRTSFIFPAGFVRSQVEKLDTHDAYGTACPTGLHLSDPLLGSSADSVVKEASVNREVSGSNAKSPQSHDVAVSKNAEDASGTAPLQGLQSFLGSSADSSVKEVSGNRETAGSRAKFSQSYNLEASDDAQDFSGTAPLQELESFLGTSADSLVKEGSVNREISDSMVRLSFSNDSKASGCAQDDSGTSPLPVRRSLSESHTETFDNEIAIVGEISDVTVRFSQIHDSEGSDDGESREMTHSETGSAPVSKWHQRFGSGKSRFSQSSISHAYDKDDLEMVTRVVAFAHSLLRSPIRYTFVANYMAEDLQSDEFLAAYNFKLSRIPAWIQPYVVLTLVSMMPLVYGTFMMPYPCKSVSVMVSLNSTDVVGHLKETDCAAEDLLRSPWSCVLGCIVALFAQCADSACHALGKYGEIFVRQIYRVEELVLPTIWQLQYHTSPATFTIVARAWMFIMLELGIVGLILQQPLAIAAGVAMAHIFAMSANVLLSPGDGAIAFLDAQLQSWTKNPFCKEFFLRLANSQSSEFIVRDFEVDELKRLERKTLKQLVHDAKESNYCFRKHVVTSPSHAHFQRKATSMASSSQIRHIRWEHLKLKYVLFADHNRRHCVKTLSNKA